MGSLTRSGISGGRRVASTTLIESLRDQEAAEAGNRADDLSTQVTKASRPAAERLRLGKSLSRSELLSLLSDAPLSDLMKLAACITGADSSVVLPRPLVLLPLDEWRKTMSEVTLKDSATQLLRGLPFSELDVAFDWLDLANLESLVGLADELSRRRPGVRFVGPAVEDIVHWLEGGQGPKLPKLGGKSRTSRAPRQLLQRLSEVLFAMRRAGFYRLRFASNLSNIHRIEALERLEEAGLTAVVGTAIRDKPEEVIDDMLTLRSLIDSGGAVGIWLPFVDPSHLIGSPKRGITEMRLLRALAVGTISLRGVPVRRASSSYLSVEGLSMARVLGANDLGYGAVDDTTMHALGILPYQSLLHAFAR